MLRVVLDTNVFVSSMLVKAGNPAQVLDAWRAGRYELVISSSIVAEIRAVLAYPRIRRKYAVDDDDAEQLVALLEHDALFVSGNAEVSNAIPADTKDEKILACAIDGQADMIVSGDPHLLDLGECRRIPILTVRQFLTRLTLEPGG
jgi:uncharacterized protein